MIHKFKKNGCNIVLDVESGTVLSVDALVYDLLGEKGIVTPGEQIALISSHPEYTDEAIGAALSEIRELIREDMLYTENDASEHNPFDMRRHDVKALCLHVSHDCNLRCEYCFAAQGDFNGERLLMSPETGKKAIDFVIANSGNRKNIEIDFFGGEPLMNLDAVKEILEYARSREADSGKHFNFTLTTNGVLLSDENMKWLDENMNNMVLSLDGRREVNDRMRKTVNGKGSYDLIKDDILKMAQMRDGKKDYYVRGTFTHNNLDFSEDVRFLADEGFKSISVEPVVAEDGCGYELKKEDLPQILAQYDKLAQDYLKRGTDEEHPDFNFFHFNLNLDGGPCVYKRLSGCGAGADYLAVTPEGDLYPCHQFVGNTDFCLGNLDTGVVREDIREQFTEAHMLNKEACGSCWARYFCGGGCHANAWNFNKDLKKPYETACEMERCRVENGLMIYIKEQEKNEEGFLES
ncbi:MAG: thioether cross-link-forming SCIFF peptide maturase [Eubacteriaceae bacterium]